MSDQRKTASLHPETRAAQAVGGLDPASGAVVPPIHPATTYLRSAGYGDPPLTDYSRYHNPTFAPLQDTLAELEGAADCLVFASGLAASAAAVMALRPGARILCHPVVYWGFRGWLVDFCRDWGLRLDFVDLRDLAALEAALAEAPVDLVWAETPCNPLWQVIDIAAVAARTRPAGARLVVDNTVATPALTRPLALGADLVMHSATKYLNGHSDVLAGALLTARRDDFWARVATNRAKVGAVLGPFEAWLLLRGLRTLYLRVARQCETALFLAQALDGHPAVAEVLYPGLPGHPGHDIARRQMDGGFGGMLGLRVRGGATAAIAVVERCRLFLRATSLGGVESLIEHRPTIEGPDSPIPPDLLRLSVGIEHPRDLLDDLLQALAPAAPAAAGSETASG